MHIQQGDQLPQWTEMAADQDPTPGWALALRNLYDAVADEPIPSDFAELLARLQQRAVQGPTH